MSTLAIDDLAVDVVGVPPPVPTIKLDRSNAHIVLTLDTGGRVQGHGMWLVGGLRTNGDVAMVRFEGVSVNVS